MDTPVSRSRAEAFLQAFAASDFKTVAEFLHDDVVWTINGPVDVLPFCGTHRGKADVLDLLARQVPAVIQLSKVVPDAILIDGNHAAMHVRRTGKRAGRVLSSRIANFFRFQDGLVISNLTLIDSYDAVEQLIGHRLTTGGEASMVDDLADELAGDLVAL